MSRLSGVRRFVRRHSSLTPSTLPSFPPPPSLAKKPKPNDSLAVFHGEEDVDTEAELWKPESYASAQPPPPSALSSFAHRIGLATILSHPDIVLQTCTHPSFYTHSPYAKYFPPPPTQVPQGVSAPAAGGEETFRDMTHVRKDNAHLATLGNSLMGLFAAEYVNASFPHLPTRVLKAAVAAYVGSLSCAAVATEMGAAPLLRWARMPKTRERPALVHSEALASIPRALTGLLYQKRSLLSARQFVHSFFLTREVDLVSMIKFQDPKKALLEMVKRAGREWPKSRLLKETGRFSQSPVFVVGIFSGEDQLGEGFGASLKMAEYRAAEDALLRVYLTRTPADQLQLPTSTFLPGLGTVFRQPHGLSSPLSKDLPRRGQLLDQGTGVVPFQEGVYVAPGTLEPPEIMYQSSGRAAVRHVSN